jgi:hypothetical protein
MSDRCFSQGGHQWPRCYTPNELKKIANSIDLEKLSPNIVERLQQAVEGFQWGSVVDDKIYPSSTNKGRRKQLKKLVDLCVQCAPTEDISAVLSKLDAIASQLLGPINRTDPTSIKVAAETALSKIPASGPDPKRARLQYIQELTHIYRSATGKHPGRRVRMTEYEEPKEGENNQDREYGPFLDFVRAALEPFGAEKGCEADIKTAIKRYKASLTGV